MMFVPKICLKLFVAIFTSPQEQQRLAQERQQLELQREQMAAAQAAKQQQQEQQRHQPVSVKDTVRDILASSDFGFENQPPRPKSVGSRVIEARSAPSTIWCYLSSLLFFSTLGGNILSHSH